VAFRLAAADRAREGDAERVLRDEPGVVLVSLAADTLLVCGATTRGVCGATAVDGFPHKYWVIVVQEDTFHRGRRRPRSASSTWT
jgi:hypothetical protein